MPPVLILHLHTASTLSLLGLIWFVQVVHYPLFLETSSGQFSTLMRKHQQRTSLVAAPLMVIEAATAAALVIRPIPGTLWQTTAGMALLAAIWLSTAFLQIPIHRRLLDRFDRQTIGRLITLNWIRTAAWSARSLLAISILATEMNR